MVSPSHTLHYNFLGSDNREIWPADTQVEEAAKDRDDGADTGDEDSFSISSH